MRSGTLCHPIIIRFGRNHGGRDSIPWTTFKIIFLTFSSIIHRTFTIAVSHQADVSGLWTKIVNTLLANEILKYEILYWILPQKSAKSILQPNISINVVTQNRSHIIKSCLYQKHVLSSNKQYPSTSKATYHVISNRCALETADLEEASMFAHNSCTVLLFQTCFPLNSIDCSYVLRQWADFIKIDSHFSLSFVHRHSPRLSPKTHKKRRRKKDNNIVATG